MGQKLLLKNIDVPGIRHYQAYRENGGYANAEKAFKMTTDEILEEVLEEYLKHNS